MNTSVLKALKLKNDLETFVNQPTIGNSENLLQEIKKFEGENFQLVQNVFLSRLLIILDASKNNDLKATIIQCINLILSGSKIQNEVHFKTLLCIILKQIYDFAQNKYRKDLSEELKLAAFKCLETASRNLDYEVVQSFYVIGNNILISQCIFVCKEALLKETYLKLRKNAVEALMSLTQVHDESDFDDIVLREQISNVLFIVLPQVATVLIRVCQEDTLRGPHLIDASIKTLGRFLCLILEDYDKRSKKTNISNLDFLNLLKEPVKASTSIKNTKNDVTKMNKSEGWLLNATEKLSKLIPNLNRLRGSQHIEIRYEFAIFSFYLLTKCLPNISLFSRFLIENIISGADDSDEKVKNYSRECIVKLKNIIPNLNEEISESFNSHLIILPRLILTGMEMEQLAGFTLLNSFLLIDPMLLENLPIMEKFIDILLNCCEMDISNELVLFEVSSFENDLSEGFYNMKMPWKKFKNLKNEAVIAKFLEICKNIGSSSVSYMCINYLLDRINSLEYLILLIEILSSDDLTLTNTQIENIIEEFMNETYWKMEVNLPKEIEKKSTNEKWFQESTPGLYESAVEIRLRDLRLEDEDIEQTAQLNLKIIRYHVLCTCFVTELMGCAALKLGKKFQPYILRLLHKILEKAGNSKFLIRSAGLYSLNCITTAMGFKEVAELINEHSDFILFNIKNQLKRNYDDESFLDMISVVFKFSKTSIAQYVEDIIETASNHLTSSKIDSNLCSYLKLFNLYACSVRGTDESILNIEEKLKAIESWSNFTEQCLYGLNKKEIEEEETINENEIEGDEENVEISGESNKVHLPHVQLIIKILKSTVPFFASMKSSEVMIAHEIFENALPTLYKFDDTNFLPIIHQMWYPFTKQFQVSNFVILQHSFRLLTLVASLAKDFVYHKATDKAIPTLNKFLNASYQHKNVSYTQEFKLQKEILNGYGQLLMDLEVEDKMLDEIINVIAKYENHQNDQLANSFKKSIDQLTNYDPILLNFKLKHF